MHRLRDLSVDGIVVVFVSVPSLIPVSPSVRKSLTDFVGHFTNTSTAYGFKSLEKALLTSFQIQIFSLPIASLFINQLFLLWK